MDNNVWQKQKRKSVGLFTDLKLFYDALDITSKHNIMTKRLLRDSLSKRVKGLIFIKELSKRVIDDLMRELIDFGWIEYLTNKKSFFFLTNNGNKALRLYENDSEAYIMLLVERMHAIYTIPGWFVKRLWDLNQKNQGEIVIPAPLRKWNPMSRQWKDTNWNNELTEQVIESVRKIKKLSEGSFPVEESFWLEHVKKSWVRLCQVPPRIISRLPADQREIIKTKPKMKTYAPRRRLANAMKEASIGFLFGSEIEKLYSIKSTSLITLSARMYMAWCPRLAELGLIFYTDSHPLVPGRIIFPVSVFRENDKPSFIKMRNIISPTNECLYLHHPQWDDIKIQFINLLYNEHQRTYRRVGSLYVSIMDVRDEVCRQLRISAELFDRFLNYSIQELTQNKAHFSISLETDIREDQASGYQKLRRLVIIDKTPYSLIAMAKLFS